WCPGGCARPRVSPTRPRAWAGCSESHPLGWESTMNTTVVKRISFLRRKSSQIGYGQLDTSLTTLSVVYLAAKMRPCSATSARKGRPHEKVGAVLIHPLRVRADVGQHL